jgi:hypothetical protein
VFRFAYDREASALVVNASGTITDELIDDYRRMLMQLDKDATAAKTTPVTIFVVTAGAERPNAKQRRALADVWSRTAAPLHLFALVTTSAIDRAIMKMIAWRHPHGRKRQSIHASFDEATEWACRERGTPIPALPSLYARACAACTPDEVTGERPIVGNRGQ